MHVVSTGEEALEQLARRQPGVVEEVHSADVVVERFDRFERQAERGHQVPREVRAREHGVELELRVLEAHRFELLDAVRQARVVEARDHQRRETEFRNEKSQQQKLLNDAKAERRRQELRSERLETTFEENEVRIGDLQEALDKRLGSLRELFGVLQQVAGDTRGAFEGSLISSQIPNRGEWLGELAAKMGQSTQLATIDEMRTLQWELQREMTESARIVRYPATVQLLNGEKKETEVVRWRFRHNRRRRLPPIQPAVRCAG